MSQTQTNDRLLSLRIDSLSSRIVATQSRVGTIDRDINELRSAFSKESEAPQQRIAKLSETISSRQRSRLRRKSNNEANGSRVA